ncbi:hypothetical protein NP493_99g02004 [Ridgeia piscesae]|uniref:Pentraxin (PTX) domain-containing protein n=1 Tax=Ridgeia piscesae TaxID=27915 RepID=A0AAD9UHM2_RIDPI|nr:hypothetical protein NP493_99g02004 [Ridgeia piscesae]
MVSALGLNSHFEFTKLSPVRYTLLLNKPFPRLVSFTVALWLNVYRRRHPGTVLSYSHAGRSNVIEIASGPTLRLTVQGEDIVTGITLNASEWLHLAWTWRASDGGKTKLHGRTKDGHSPIRGGGELVVGQASRTAHSDYHYDLKYAFLGELGLINIWHRAMSPAEVKSVYSDCLLQTCGDAIEWADFRSGTRGAMRIRWPSMILVFAHRTCLNGDDDDGVWSEADIDECARKEDLSLKNASTNVSGSRVLSFANKLKNHTGAMYYENPVDLAIERIIDHGEESDGVLTYGLSRRLDQSLYPQLDHTQQFAKTILGVLGNLLDRRHNSGWSGSLPPGAVGEQFMKSKEDNINTPLLAVSVQVGASPFGRFLRPITVQLPYVNNFNISNPVCLSLQQRKQV